MVNEILFVVILAIANIIQGITGFAGGPLSLPPTMLLVGVNSAKVAVTAIFWISSLLIVVKNYKKINPKKLAFMLVIMAVGVVLGMWAYDLIPATILMLVYGIIVVLIGLKKLLIKSSKEVKPPLSYIFIFLGGIMQGMFTSGSPFLVMYATTVIKDKQEFRATMSAIWLALNTYMLINMYTKGMITGYEGKLVLEGLIPVLGGVFIGGKIAHKINQEIFNKLVYILLVISGSILVFNALH